MVNIAPERDIKQSDERRTSRELPYDPKEWEQRVALARAQREKILQQRAADARRGKNDASAASTRAIPTKTLGPPQSIDSLTDVFSGKRDGDVRAARTLRAVPAKLPVADGPLHTKGKWRHLLAGLLLGSVAGGSAVMLAGSVLPKLGLPMFPVTQQPSSQSPEAASDAIVQRPAVSPPEVRPAPISAPAAATAGAPVGVPDASPSAQARDMEPEILPNAPILAELSAGFASRQDPVLAPPDAGILLSGMEPGPERSEEWALSVSQAGVFSSSVTLADTAPQIDQGAPQPPVSRIAIHIPQRIGTERKDLIIARLTDTEWPTQIIETPFTISETHVRFFHPQDQNAAEALAALTESTARDFTHFQPSPENGYLELWLNGQGTPAPHRSAPMPVATPAIAAPSASVSPTVSSPVSQATAPRATREGRGMEILLPRLGVSSGPAARTGISPSESNVGRVSSPETGSTRADTGSGASAGTNGGGSGGNSSPGNSAEGRADGGSNAAEGSASSGGGGGGGGNGGGNGGGRS